ncbi:MAG: hypothetical protein BGN83_14375 [Rhizobium sp. 63-7]|nr:MAG: hypothetical protein BGN83_14375 [Rhizobium sp. 63-7]
MQDAQDDHLVLAGPDIDSALLVGETADVFSQIFSAYPGQPKCGERSELAFKVENEPGGG